MILAGALHVCNINFVLELPASRMKLPARCCDREVIEGRSLREDVRSTAASAALVVLLQPLLAVSIIDPPLLGV